MHKNNFFSKIITISLILSNFLCYNANCSEISPKTTNLPEVSQEVKSDETSENIKFLAQKFKIKESEFENLLYSNDKKQKLVPASKNHLELFKAVFCHNNSEYMKYFAYGKGKPENLAEKILENKMSRMYKKDKELPASLTFVIIDNNKAAGVVMVGPVSNKSYPEVAYIIKKDYANRGLGGFAVKTLLLLLKKLRENKIYSYSKIYATCHPNNLYSNKILKNAGFSTDGKEIKKDFGPRYEYFYTFENTEKEQ